MADGRQGRRYPPWVRVALVALQVAGLLVGIAIGNATYSAWSTPDDPQPTATTTVQPAEPEPAATLG